MSNEPRTLVLKVLKSFLQKSYSHYAFQEKSRNVENEVDVED